MNSKEFVFAMRISRLAENDYFIDYPFDGMTISGSAETLTEAVELAKSSLEFTLFDIYEAKESFPEMDEGALSELEKKKEANQYITLVATNLTAILKRFSEEPVKRMVSIKKYQDFYLNNNNISISKYVQEKIDQDIQKV
ncbi:hypothetical protein [Enterococcus pallens]|uniref:HicB-like antitoxin of toxin-antitoxin system domain-containing protein n=1 Tax=Enterococcus pallens ATCC BAA-351 TaxID=1158607 RepID=R2SFH6_9ENTE|nr:hypothetical protein [Enterococcus pallens]EOH91666.1 hypothetical protein UAU_02968 [Enterococcus pallens ATCC BAA-351]EOU25094.1 hypothetical protein I588_01082 [Enterococcus pallens ATCC BAA-351]OJG78508.1 hypothetical protein RV10_GL001503 [Enterococcus pallens]